MSSMAVYSDEEPMEPKTVADEIMTEAQMNEAAAKARKLWAAAPAMLLALKAIKSQQQVYKLILLASVQEKLDEALRQVGEL